MEKKNKKPTMLELERVNEELRVECDQLKNEVERLGGLLSENHSDYRQKEKEVEIKQQEIFFKNKKIMRFRETILEMANSQKNVVCLLLENVKLDYEK